MAKITPTQETVGSVVGYSDDNGPGYKLSDGSALLSFGRSAMMATGPDDAKSTFVIFDRVPEGKEVEKNMIIHGGAGKDNVIILPGKAADYKVGIAQDPQGKGRGTQKFGDVTITDKQGNHIHAQNIKSLVFLDGKPTSSLTDVINGIASGTVKTVSTKALHDADFAKLSSLEQCRHKALTSDELGKMSKELLPTDKFHKPAEVAAADRKVEVAATKSCPAR